MVDKKDLFFIGIQNPDEVRKVLLESWKEVVESLERYENFKEIRKERVENIEKFKKNVKEISRLITELKEKLPETGLKPAIPKIKEQETGKSRKQPTKKPKARKKEKTELDRLEDELGQIEAKLNSLA